MGKSTPRRPRQGQDDDGWGNLREAPRLDVPDARKRIVKRGLATAWVWLSIFAAPLLAIGLVSELVAPDQGSGRAAADEVVVSATDQVAKASAVARMNAWLAADSPQLPGGRVLTVDDRVERVDYNDDAARRSAAKNGGQTITGKLSGVQIVWFTLADTVGNLYRSAVAVTVDQNGIVTSVSSPSLERLPASSSGQGAATAPWPGMESSSPSEAVGKAVTAWAQAYASGDAAALRQAIGDTDPEHLYVPLPEAAAVKVDASAAAQIVPANPDRPGEQVLAVRVDLVLAWSGDAAASVDQVSASKELSRTSVDVLVERADTAAPQVVAWGAPGTGPALQRFGNALSVDSAPKQSGPGIDKAPSVSPAPSTEPVAGPASEPSVTEGTD